jgi:GntR family carbon starvation induced transcriptional regulator
MRTQELEETQAGIAAERIMADIRTGLLRPGHKLKMAELRARYGMGASPLREALSMVTSLGYVTSESHRGYRVAAVSENDRAAITRAREVIEAGMLRESMLAHNDEWAIGVLSATERLRRLTAKCALGTLEGIDPIQAAHKQLHMALVSGCTSKRLATMQALLFDQAARYRDIMIGEVRSAQHFFDTHEELVQVVLSGDVERACESLRDHLRRTLREVYSGANGRIEKELDLDSAAKFPRALAG